MIDWKLMEHVLGVWLSLRLFGRGKHFTSVALWLSSNSICLRLASILKTFQHPRIGGPGLVGHFEYPDGYIE